MENLGKGAALALPNARKESKVPFYIILHPLQPWSSECDIFSKLHHFVFECLDGWLDGLITCNFTSFSAVFQSYQKSKWVTMKACVAGSPVYYEKDFCLQESISGSLDQQARAYLTELLGPWYV